jgi:hypothetical protein
MIAMPIRGCQNRAMRYEPSQRLLNSTFYRKRTGNREFLVESFAQEGLRLKMVGEILIWRAARTEADLRPGSVGALVIKQCFRTYDFPRRCTGLVGQ